MKIEKLFCYTAGGLFGFMLINLSSINKIETICQDPYCLGVPLSKKKKGAGFSLQSSLPQTSGREGFTLQSLTRHQTLMKKFSSFIGLQTENNNRTQVIRLYIR